MKNDLMKCAIVLLSGLLVAGCVDDFRDYNPPAAKDAPLVRVNTTGASQMLLEVPVNAYQTTPVVYTLYEPVTFNVDVVRAKGLVDGVSVESSILEFGTVTLDEASANAISGSESGSFRFTFTPSTTLPDMTDRTVNVVVHVSDSQVNEDGDPQPLTTTITVPVTLTTGCFSSGLIPGSYAVIEASGNLDGNTAYTYDDLVAAYGEVPTVTISQVRPGLYRFNEVTGGIWPAFYSGRATPNILLDLCTSALTDHLGADAVGSGSTRRTFTVNGTLNDDATITVNWSYVLNSGATPASPAQGMYKLKAIGL